MKLKREDGPESEIEILERRGESIKARVDGREIEAAYQRLGEDSLSIEIGGIRFRIFAARDRDRIMVAAGPYSIVFHEVEEGRSGASRGLAAREITAPMPGKVLRVLVREAQRVEAGDALILLEAMKMETTLSSESAAVIAKILVAEGQSVDHGAILIELAPATPDPSPPESSPLGP